MRRSPIVAAALGLGLYLVPGCPEPAPPPHKPAPIGISPLALCRAPDSYCGMCIRVMLVPRDYQPTPEGLVWVDGKPGMCHVLFKCDHRTDREALDIVGTCRGKFGAELVIVADCTVTVIPRQPLLSPAALERP